MHSVCMTCVCVFVHTGYMCVYYVCVNVCMYVKTMNGQHVVHSITLFSGKTIVCVQRLCMQILASSSRQPVISAALCLFTNIFCYSASGTLLCAVVCIFDINGYLVCTVLIVCLP